MPGGRVVVRPGLPRDAEQPASAVDYCADLTEIVLAAGETLAASPELRGPVDHQLSIFDLDGQFKGLVTGMLRRPCKIQQRGEYPVPERG